MKQKEQGITLVALIVTIIILIILAAVTIYAVTKNNFLGLATAGTQNYAGAQVDESTKMDDLVDKLEETLSNIVSIQTADGEPGGGDTPEKPPVELPEKGTAVPAEGWSVEVAKGLVKRDGLAEHLGEKVNYNPPAGGTWRIFYYDNEDQGNGKGYFGDPVGTVYLRRVTDSIPSDIMESLDSERESHMLDNLNPIMEGNWVTGTSGFKWATGFADPSLWSNYCDQTSSRYAVGAPSFEMLWKIIEVIERCKW